MLKYIDTVKIPTYAVCYIFNGDCSGMDDADIEAVDKFCEKYPGATYDIPDMDSPYFTNSPAFGLACDVYDMDIYMEVDEEKKFYVLDADYIPDDKTFNDISDTEFQKLVSRYGWTLTAEQLAAEISEDGNYCPVPQTHFVRYM